MPHDQPARGSRALGAVRLARHAREIGVDPNLVLTRYAVERFLYRLSRSEHAERFVLKGALLMLVWLGEQLRPTSDADLLGTGDLSRETLERILREVVSRPVEADAVEFDLGSVDVEPIRAEDDYGGWRATVRARVGAARLTVQVDVGIGDAVTPDPLARLPRIAGPSGPTTARLSARDRHRGEVACDRPIRDEEQQVEGLLRHPSPR